MINIDMDKYTLWIFWFISLIVTIGVLNRYAPVWPVLPFVSYGLTCVFVVLATYLTAILGNLSYLVAENKTIKTALEESNNMEKFLRALGEPVMWGHLSLVSTLGYFTVIYYNYTPLIGAMQFFSISSTLTAAFSILRNLHMIRLFSTVSLRESVVNNYLKETFFQDMLTQMKQMEDKEEDKGIDTTVN